MEQARDVAQRLLQERQQSLRSHREASGQGKQAPVSVVSPTASCPVCKGIGFTRADVPVGHPDFGKALPCQCQQEARRRARQQQLRAQSQVDQLRAFREASFGTFDSWVPGLRSVYLAALQYAKQPEGWLVLVGGNGCGKTHLAVAVAKHCLEREIPTLFALVPDLLDQLRATFEAEAEEGYSEVLRQMKEVELLILDDLGSQAGTPWAKEKLFQLLNFRYNSGLATVITTNDVGFAGMDSRLRSRFGDRRLVQIVTIAAPDFRLHIPPDA